METSMPFACKEAEKMPYNANTRAAEGRKRQENVDLRTVSNIKYESMPGIFRLRGRNCAFQKKALEIMQ